MYSDKHPLHALINDKISRLPKRSFIADIGTSGQFDKEVSFYSDALKNHRYFALGYNPDSQKDNACDLNGDILQLGLKSNTLNAVICLEVLEHVHDPLKAAQELTRVLKPGGLLILTTPFLYPYHGKSSNLNDYSHESYPDYFRFTHQGLQNLFREFNQLDIYPFTSSLGYLVTRFLPKDLDILYQSPLKEIFFHATAPVLTDRHLIIGVK